MAEVIEVDVAVLGAGPGGYAAAFLAADRGLRVALIDPRERPGGVCLHVGCIPSKALLHVARLRQEIAEAAAWGLHTGPLRVDLETLRARKEQIVASLAGHLAEAARQRKITYLRSRGRFAGSTRLQLENGDQVRFRHCILATGSRPVTLPALQVDSPRLWDSTQALALSTIPTSLLVVGGGYIGLELGSVYAALGSRVTLVELTGGLLPGVDPDLVRPLYNRLKNTFEKIYLNTKVVRIEENAAGLRAWLEGAEVEPEPRLFDAVLMAVGRRPNSDDLGLETTGVRCDARGYIQVDERRRTTDEHIFAIGDVAGEPLLAHKAAHEGKVAVQVIVGEPAAWDVRAIPAVVFTDPEIAWCGLTETQAQQQRRPVKVARFDWRASGRATTLGRTDGLTKLIVDAETERLLGVGISGVGAGEMIAEGVLALEMGATARDLALTLHPHPTLTETVGEAAESLYGLATHLYRVRPQQKAGA
jgi:dihydrolipoamide dehydrogenase